MRLEELIDKMIPSDIERQLPCFSEILTLRNLYLSDAHKKKLQYLLKENKDFGNEDDVTIILKRLRKQNPIAVKELEIKVLEAYFSHPEIIKKITGEASTIFPTQRSLPDFDFELLEPVLNLDTRISSNGE